MMLKSILIFVAIVIAQTNTVYGMGSDSCSYYRFLTQPPLTLDCDPYDRIPKPMNKIDIIWRLRIHCEVERISSDAGTFDVHWFRRDPVTQTVTNLGRVDTINFQNNERIEIVYGLRIVNEDFRENMLGDFWCQVINTTTTPHTGLGISNTLTILHPDEYDSSLASCSNIIGNETVTCADFADVPPIETTTMSSSSTQTTEQPNRVSQTQTLPSTSHEHASITISSSLGGFNEHVHTNTDTISLISSTTTVPNRPNTNGGVTTATPTLQTNSNGPSQSTGTTYTITVPPLIQTRSFPINTLLPSTPAQDILIRKTDAHLILAASIGGAMLILIIVLLTIVVALLCTNKNKPPTGARDDCEKTNEMQRMSALRSSQRPLLLDSTSLSPDPAHQFTTSYSNCEALPDPSNTPQTHHYSVIRDSFQPSQPVPPMAQQIHTPSFVIPEMTENQYYSTADEVVNASTDESHNGSVTEPSMDDDNQYSSLKLNSSNGKSPPSEGYNKLRQNTPSNATVNSGAYSTLYDPSTTTSAAKTDQVNEPYNTLSYNTGGLLASSPPQYQTPMGNGSTPVKPSFKLAANSNTTNEYDEVYDDSQESAATTTQGFDDPQYSVVVKPKGNKKQKSIQNNKKKTAAMLPPSNYEGDYERDPNYSYAFK